MLIIALEKHVTVFQAEIYAILACAYENQTDVRREKYISIYSGSQAALKALEAARTMSPLVWQCQRVLNDVSTYHSVGLLSVPRYCGICGNEIANEMTEGSVYQFV
jgi:hypothetical protein